MTQTQAAKPATRKRQQIAQSLRELTSRMAPGERLPSVADLERQFGAATATVEAAIGLLRSENLVESRPRSGTYVAPRPASKGALARAGGPGDQDGGKTGTLAALAFDDCGIFRHCIEHLTTQASQAGLSVVCHYAKAKANFEDALPLEALRPQGFLLVSYHLASVAQGLIGRGHPTVVLGVPAVGQVPMVPCVYGNHEQGGYLATRHLLDLGHRKIAFAYDDPQGKVLDTYRWLGHQRALREVGITNNTLVIGPTQIDTWRRDEQALLQFFQSPDAPTAIAAWNDTAALTWMRLLRRAGLRVPDDVSLVGYDALPEGAQSDPPLDTIDQHLDVQIRSALGLLQAEREPSHIPIGVVLPTLLRRASCARPRR